MSDSDSEVRVISSIIGRWCRRVVPQIIGIEVVHSPVHAMCVLELLGNSGDKTNCILGQLPRVSGLVKIPGLHELLPDQDRKIRYSQN